MRTPLQLMGDGFVLNYSAIESPRPEDYPPHFHEAWELLFFPAG